MKLHARRTIAVGELITALHAEEPRAIRCVVARVLSGALSAFAEEDAPAPRFVRFLPRREEGFTWARGHGEDTEKALLVARALRST